MKKSTLIFLVLIGLFLSNCKKNTDEPEVIFHGRVTYPDGITGVPRVPIALKVTYDADDEHLYCDDNGYFQFSRKDLSPIYRIVVNDYNDRTRVNYLTGHSAPLYLGEQDFEYNVTLYKVQLTSDYFFNGNTFWMYHFDLSKLNIGDKTEIISRIYFFTTVDSFSIYKIPENIQWSDTSDGGIDVSNLNRVPFTGTFPNYITGENFLNMPNGICIVNNMNSDFDGIFKWNYGYANDEHTILIDYYTDK